MTWDLLKDYGPISLALALTVERFISWAFSKQFATTETVAALGQVGRDQETELRALITAERHRIDLLEQLVRSLPGYDQVNDIKHELGEVKEVLAGQEAKLDGLKDGLAVLRVTVERVGEDVRRSK